MLKIRRSRDRSIFNTGISIVVRRHIHTETAPWFFDTQLSCKMFVPVVSFSCLRVNIFICVHTLDFENAPNVSSEKNTTNERRCYIAWYVQRLSSLAETWPAQMA